MAFHSSKHEYLTTILSVKQIQDERARNTSLYALFEMIILYYNM